MDLDLVTELTGLAIDLDAVVEELLEVRAVKDTVASRARVVDDELVLSSSRLSGGGLGLHKEEREKTQCKPTEKVTQQSGTGD